MDASCFVIRFPEHLPHERMQYCLNDLADRGGAIENIDERTFRVTCDKPKPLASVGWALFHTHFANLCRVVEASGAAVNSAKAYRDPP